MPLISNGIGNGNVVIYILDASLVRKVDEKGSEKLSIPGMPPTPFCRS